VPLVLATSLAEGAGLFWMCALHHGAGSLPALVAFGAILLVRLLAWLAYRRSVRASVEPAAFAALDRAGRVLTIGGTLLPIVLVTLVASGGASSAATLPIAAVAGLAALASGAWLKAALVLRAGFQQGFVLPHLPVRGVRS
jgi:phenylacetyl-CoA:acceptor oxidoreductase subunit 2